jgi:hypothetical protein
MTELKNQEPAEGSRETVDKELARQDAKETLSDRKPTEVKKPRK